LRRRSSSIPIVNSNPARAPGISPYLRESLSQRQREGLAYYRGSPAYCPASPGFTSHLHRMDRASATSARGTLVRQNSPLSRCDWGTSGVSQKTTRASAIRKQCGNDPAWIVCVGGRKGASCSVYCQSSASTSGAYTGPWERFFSLQYSSHFIKSSILPRPVPHTRTFEQQV
jgi:hypothetical protein